MDAHSLLLSINLGVNVMAVLVLVFKAGGLVEKVKRLEIDRKSAERDFVAHMRTFHYRKSTHNEGEE